MRKALRCDCGFEASGQDEDQLVAEVQRHAAETHGMALSHEEALLLAFRAELDEEVLAAVSREPSSEIEHEEER